MKKLITIIGQTSSGKSSLAIGLAKKFNGEIVSADSRQVYRGLDYCSGKVSKEEQSEVKHHLIDVVELKKAFTLYDFQKMAYNCIDEIISKGKVPFLVGGTGLYSRSVVEGYNLSEYTPDEKTRKKLEEKSLDELIKLCNKKNIQVPKEPTKRRLIRLLENINHEKLPNKPRYEVLQLAIKFDREEIYNRIKLRLNARMPKMIEEIKNLISGDVNKEFLRSLGLEAKFVTDYLDNKFSSFNEFFEELFKEERHFAKRQDTWLKKEKNVVWLDGKGDLLGQAEVVIQKFLNS